MCTLTLDLLEGEELIGACSTVLHFPLADKVLGRILMDTALEALVQSGRPFQTGILILCSDVPANELVVRTCDGKPAKETATEISSARLYMGDKASLSPEPGVPSPNAIVVSLTVFTR